MSWNGGIIMSGELEMIWKVQTVYSLCKVLFVMILEGLRKKYENFSYDRL